MRLSVGPAAAVAALSCLITAVATCPARGGAIPMWQGPFQLNTPDDDPRRVTVPRVAASKNGGFHVVYQAWDNAPNPRPEYMRYRRVTGGGVPGAVVTIQKPANGANQPDVAEAPNGDVHVVWESWGNGPEIGWARSTNNGASFGTGIEVSASGRQAQGAQIVGFGTGNSPQAIVTWRNTSDDSLEYRRFDGTNWLGIGWTGDFTGGATAGGIARSPLDGTVHKMVDRGSNLGIRRFTGTSFGAAQDNVMPFDFWVEPSMAVNDAGHAMVMVDRDYVAKARVVRADGSLGPIFEDVFNGKRMFGNVAAIPGTNDFYAVTSEATQQRAQNRKVIGRRYFGDTGQWGAIETIATLPYDELLRNIEVGVDPAGNMLAVFEFWEIVNPDPNNYLTKPNVYYASLTVPEPASAALVLAGLIPLARPRRCRLSATH